MLTNENFIVGVTCFVPADDLNLDFLRNLNRFIVNAMDKKGFSPEETTLWDLEFGGKPSFTLTFTPQRFRFDPGLKDKLQVRLGLRRRMDLLVELRDKYLRRTLDEFPDRIAFFFEFVSSEGSKKGYRIRIECEPSILAKNRILGKSLEIGREAYDRIITYEVRYVREISALLFSSATGEPQVLKHFESPPQESIFDAEFIGRMPEDVGLCLQAAETCFKVDHLLTSAVMLRKAIDVAVVKKFYQTNAESRLFDKEGNEISLERRLGIVAELAPRIRRDVDQVRLVKWLGDKAAHDPSFSISASDIRENIPRVKTFLIGLELKK